jgi:hypothetical protein
MNTQAALLHMDKQLADHSLKAYPYSIHNGTVYVILLVDMALPSRPIVARGIAIQSPDDKLDRQIKRYWALRRALSARKHREASEPILPHMARNSALTERLTVVYKAYSIQDKPVYKSQNAPVLPEGGKARTIELAILAQIATAPK